MQAKKLSRLHLIHRLLIIIKCKRSSDWVLGANDTLQSTFLQMQRNTRARYAPETII